MDLIYSKYCKFNFFVLIIGQDGYSVCSVQYIYVHICQHTVYKITFELENIKIYIEFMCKFQYFTFTHI